jgi:hypothetical protein
MAVNPVVATAVNIHGYANKRRNTLVPMVD